MVTQEHHVALVDRLVECSEPVHRLWPLRARAGLLLTAWIVAGVIFALAWPRPDLATKLDQSSFLVELAALSIATGFTALMALRCAVPGRAPTRAEKVTTLLLVIVASSTIGANVEPIHASRPEWPCGLRTIVIATLPWVGLLMAIRRGAPVHDTSAAGYAATAALLYSATLLRTACPIDGARHWLLWHLGIATLAALLAIPLGKRWLRRWRHR